MFFYVHIIYCINYKLIKQISFKTSNTDSTNKSSFVRPDKIICGKFTDSPIIDFSKNISNNINSSNSICEYLNNIHYSFIFEFKLFFLANLIYLFCLFKHFIILKGV